MHAIPQEPCFLPGSVRQNMDPHGASDGASIKRALGTAVIQQQDGLDADLAQLNLSNGQKQLFRLGRATLNQCKIAVLDEPTSK